MDPYERYYRRSLRETLVGQGILAQEQADELAEAAFASHEPFGLVLVDAGVITAYDLMKAVATHYQMPVLPLEGYDLDKSLLQGVPSAVLYQHHALPIGRFGQTWSFAVLEPPSRDCVASLRQACGGTLFFFAVSAPELQRILSENVQVMDVKADKGWESLFDQGDERVRDELSTA
jgi:hypothetical protein